MPGKPKTPCTGSGATTEQAFSFRSLVILMTSWAGVLAIGIVALAAYSNEPGILATAPDDWPTDSSIERATDRATVLFFLHPKCGCSTSTMREFQRLFGTPANAVDVQIGFYRPPSRVPSWTDTSLMQLARRISPDGIFEDIDGREASRFGATTSGHGFVFSPAGKMLFSGGITSSRGHEGSNVGATQMRQAIESLTKQLTQTSVFGCPIRRGTAL